MRTRLKIRIRFWFPFVLNILGALAASFYFMFIDPSSNKIPLLMIISAIILLSAIELAQRQGHN